MADINKMYIGGEPVKEIRFAKAAETDDGTWDASTQECWDAYAGSEQVYHKDKTVENCWKKYGLLHDTDDGSFLTLDMAAVPKGKTGVLPEAVDWQQHVLPTLGSGLKGIRWNGEIANTGFWDKLNEYIATHDIVVVAANAPADSGFTEEDDNHAVASSQWFRGSNRTGDFRVNFNGYNPYATFPDMFYFMNIDKLTICFKSDSVRVSSAIRLFRYLNVKEIEILDKDGVVANGTGKKYIGAYDISAIGENMTYPGEFPDIIDWTQRQVIDGYACTKIGYAFTQCKQMTGIAQCATATERDSDGNTIKASAMSDQAFENCNALTSIGPVLDLAAVAPTDGKENQSGSGAYRMFAGCSALADVRIKNLNAGLWRFDDDSYVGNIPRLDSESVAYLFANLMDLTGVPSVSSPSNNFTDSWATTWLTGERDVSQVSTGARLPNTWPDYFLTVGKAVTLEVHVSGLQPGDRLEWGTGSAAPSASESSITADGDYALTSEDGATYGFRLYNDNIADNKYYTDNAHKVTITLKNPYAPAGIKGNSGTIYCPAEWDSKVTQEMVNAASAKGWTTYVGGVLQLPCVALYDVAAQGATNESLQANPTLTDLSGNGHDIALVGFDFKGLSGVGGYYFKNLHAEVTGSNSPATYDIASDLSNITILECNKETIVFQTLMQSVREMRDVHYKIRVTGLDALRATTHPDAVINNSQNRTSPLGQRITSDGEYELQGVVGADDYTYVSIYLVDDNTPFQPDEAINVTIEQLPLYPNALVSDGADCYGYAGNEYAYDFLDNKWQSLTNGGMVKESSTLFKINYTTDGADVLFNGTDLDIKIRISGLSLAIERGETNLLMIYPRDNQDVMMKITEDGDYNVHFTSEQLGNSTGILFVVRQLASFMDENFTDPITIEQLPVNSFPAIKSMIVKYKFYEEDFTGDAPTEGYEYAFELLKNPDVYFRLHRDVETGDIAGTPLTWQQLGEDTFYAVNNADAGFDLNLFSRLMANGIRDLFGRVAFYKMALFDHALSEEELEAAKTKFL